MSALHQLFKAFAAIQRTDAHLRLRKQNGQTGVKEHEEVTNQMRAQFENMCNDVESLLKIRLLSPS